MHLQRWIDLCLPKSQGGLAMRDVYSLNIALSTKHVWKLINPADNSLISTTVGARYLDNQIPAVISKRSNSSWIWKGILKAGSIILDNLRWRIGDRKIININHHAWWPMLRAQQSSVKVADLIPHNSIHWNRQEFMSIYDNQTVHRIYSTPFSMTGINDRSYGDVETSELWKGSRSRLIKIWVQRASTTPLVLRRRFILGITVHNVYRERNGVFNVLFMREGKRGFWKLDIP
ncbi:putative mitochondrial protein [Senna tora]|uniref:Putative mitochondrial protein n=1 Tax=Senna tora TaxID=362788 RepID=A0A834XBN4_9FABA|nr:putative mitochondrial protein [Senna tora]